MQTNLYPYNRNTVYTKSCSFFTKQINKKTFNYIEMYKYISRTVSTHIFIIMHTVNMTMDTRDNLKTMEGAKT